MPSRIYLYQDRCHLSKVPELLKVTLKRHHLLLEKDNTVSFSGMVISEGSAHVFLPRNTPLPENNTDEAKVCAASTLNAIHKYSQNSDSARFSLDGGNDIIGEIQLGLILALFNDYQKMGIYTHRKTESKLNTGKPNWSKTVSRSICFPSSSGPIYLDLWGRRQINTTNNEITKIHAYVLTKLSAKFGWITSNSHFLSKELEHIPPPRNKENAFISQLTTELNNVYSDRDIWLLKALIKYLKLESGGDQSQEVMGIRSFHVMWENMLSHVLDYTVKMNSQLPRPAYTIKIDNREEVTPASRKNQRIDIVLKSQEENRYCVVDAKYYGATSIESAPGWHDIVKQFFYVKALKVIVPADSNINNAFIFPGKDGVIKAVNMQNEATEELLQSDYPEITCYYLPPLEVIDHYLKNKKMPIFSQRLLAIS